MAGPGAAEGKGCLAWWLAACVLWWAPASATEGWDIKASIFSDRFCYERYQNLLLLDGACYSTMEFSNTSVAFRLKIVRFGGTGSKWVIDYQEFADDCKTPIDVLPTSLTVGNCISFLGRFRAELEVRLRSPRCRGSSCSALAIAEQNFYAKADCQGDPIVALRQFVPVQGECLVMRNLSSQTYTLMPDMNVTRIRRLDYPSDTKCASLLSKEYNILGQCYPLYDSRAPRSFSWTAHRKTLNALNASWRPSALWTLLLSAVLAQALNRAV